MVSGPRLLQPDEAGRLLYEGLTAPICLLDTQERLVAMNPAAERYWGRSLQDVGGALALEALGIRPVARADNGEGLSLFHAAGGEGVVVCTLAGDTAEGRTVSLRVMDLPGAGSQHILLGVLPDALPLGVADALHWAWTDPVTGLGNRACYERARARWDRAGGAVAFLDLDDLKGLNDLYGHATGDQALALAGEILRQRLPAGGLGVRYGGDEFLVLTGDAATAEALALQVQAELGQRGRSALPLAPGMSWGVAAFGPGGLESAVRLADEALYERKGVLLRAATGGRIVLTRAGQRQLEHEGEGFRSMPPRDRGLAVLLCGDMAGAVAEARAFVAFAAAPQGGAVVEVGAGVGRITVEGGLAAAVGPRGQLLVTDPVEIRLQAARRCGADHGHTWVRYLQAVAEDLPLASGTADLVLGALFLQRADAGRALVEMARTVRPGGRIAFSALLPLVWPDLWRQALEPVGGAADGGGLPHAAAAEARLHALVAAAGMEVVRAEVHCYAMAAVATPAAGIEVLQRLRQTGVLGIGPAAVQCEREEGLRLADGWERYAPGDRRLQARLLYLVARKPSTTALA